MTTTLQRLATVFGIVLTLLAIVGAFAAGAMYMQPTDPAMASKALGIFPVNLLHNIVHLLSGLWGLAAARSWGSAKSFFVWGEWFKRHSPCWRSCRRAGLDLCRSLGRTSRCTSSWRS